MSLPYKELPKCLACRSAHIVLSSNILHKSIGAQESFGLISTFPPCVVCSEILDIKMGLPIDSESGLKHTKSFENLG